MSKLFNVTIQTERGGFVAQVYARNYADAWREVGKRFSAPCRFIELVG
jgi:hypothetical protein